MEDERTIEVSMTPHPWDNKEAPYFWCILKWCKTSWCNDSFGWSKSPQEAWEDATKRYEHKMLEIKEKENK